MQWCFVCSYSTQTQWLFEEIMSHFEDFCTRGTLIFFLGPNGQWEKMISNPSHLEHIPRTILQCNYELLSSFSNFSAAPAEPQTWIRSKKVLGTGPHGPCGAEGLSRDHDSRFCDISIFMSVRYFATMVDQAKPRGRTYRAQIPQFLCISWRGLNIKQIVCVRQLHIWAQTASQTLSFISFHFIKTHYFFSYPICTFFRKSAFGAKNRDGDRYFIRNIPFTRCM